MKFTGFLTSSAHAYIVEGKGASRRTFVLNFIKALNCEDESAAARPCGTCPSCRQIDAGTSMDVIYMEKSGKTGYMVKDASTLIDRLALGSYGRHVIGVIEDADLLGETVQNKLLKTLEEPEPGVVIILATNNADNLLSTVRSRCNLIKLSSLADAGELETADAADELAEGIAELADQMLAKHNFYELRNAIDKKIKSQDDAILLLGQLEDRYHEQMFSTKNEKLSGAIELIETARMDIYSGMSYSKALRRLALELS